MSLDFSPRERMDLILPGIGTSHRVVGSSEVEIDSAVVGENEVERRQEV